MKASSLFKAFGRQLMRHFLRGVLVLAPIFITVSILHWGFLALDGLLRPFIATPGIGFAVVLATLLIVGWFSSLFPVERLLDVIDGWLESLPGVNFVYSSVRDFFKAFIGNKRRFKHTVRVSIFADDVWVIGFLTDEDLRNLELGKEFVAVYVPQAYNIAGQLYLVRRQRVQALKDIGPGDAMKYAATGGAVELAEAK